MAKETKKNSKTTLNIKDTKKSKKTKRAPTGVFNIHTAIIKSTRAHYDKQLYSLSDLCSMKAKNAFTWVYGMDPSVTFTDKEIVKEFNNARDWWETANGAAEQCDKTIGTYKKDTLCYICGLSMETDNLEKFTPECEHILPVYQASLFLTLYSKRHKQPSENVKKEFSIEYAWAHRCCNQVKGDTSFLNFDSGKNKFIFHDKHASEILSDIYGGKDSYCSELSYKIKKQFPNKSKWINERMDIIQTEKLQPICNYLNKSLNMSKGLFYLGILANLISAADKEYLEPAQINAKGIDRMPPGEAIIKAEIYDFISGEIADYFSRISMKNELNNLLNSLLLNIKEHDALIKNDKVQYKNIKSLLLSLLCSGDINKLVIKEDGFSFSEVYRDLFSLSTSPVFDTNKSPLMNNKNNAAFMCKDGIHVLCYALLLNNANNMSTEYEKLYTDATSRIQKKNLEIINSVLIGFKNYLLQQINDNWNSFREKCNEESDDKRDTIISLYLYITKKIGVSVENFVNMEDFVYKSVDEYIDHKNLLYSRNDYSKKYNINFENMTQKDIEEDISKLEVSAVDVLTNLLSNYETVSALSEENKTQIIEDIKIQKAKVEENIENTKDIYEQKKKLEKLSANSELGTTAIKISASASASSPGLSPSSVKTVNLMENASPSQDSYREEINDQTQLLKTADKLLTSITKKRVLSTSARFSSNTTKKIRMG